MFILASSTTRTRYRDDILRAIALPIGTELQFRYDERLVETQLKNNPDRICGEKAIICSVDVHSEENGICPLVPARVAHIDRVHLHGSTVSVRVVTEAFPTELRAPFTLKASKDAAQVAPRPGATPGRPDGFFFFEAPNSLAVEQSRDIRHWEIIATQLFETGGYAEEPYFWSVLGLFQTQHLAHESELAFSCWPSSIKYDKEYTVAIYVFHPDSKVWDTQEDTFGPQGLFVEHSEAITTASPDVLTIDSPYDLKRWPLKVSRFRQQGDEEVWIRLGPLASHYDELPRPATDLDSHAEGNAHAREIGRAGNTVGSVYEKEDWDIILPLQLDIPWARVIAGVFGAGALIGTTGIPAIVLAQGTSGEARLAAIVGAIVAGILAATLVHWNVRKLV